MRILVTAGNTQAPIDRVRCITNIFTGRTGSRIAVAAHSAGHDVSLLTSHPEVIADLGLPSGDRWRMETYRTFDDLEELLHRHVAQGAFDAVIHVAAVNDYRTAGVYRWEKGATEPKPLDRAIGKIKSDSEELWLKLVRTPKLIDRMRKDWGFTGTLVKFKLEVRLSDSELLAVAEASRKHSDADLMVANTLEGATEWAYLGPLDSRYEKINRTELPVKLLAAIERVRK